MILTCPDCATSYYVPDAAVGQGRKVRCATCGFAWRARPEDNEEEDLPVDVAPPRAPRAAPDSVDEEEAGPEPQDEDLEPEPDIPPEPEATEPEPREPPMLTPQPRGRERKASAGAAQVMAIAAVLGGLAVAVALFLVFRVEVARLWPASAGAFARIGLPVNAVGLTLDDVRAQRLLEAGRPALVVSGVMTNIRAEPVSPPPVSIVLFDRKGRLLTEVRSGAGGGPLAPRQARSFQVTLADPPASAAELEVSFAVGKGPRGSAR